MTRSAYAATCLLVVGLVLASAADAEAQRRRRRAEPEGPGTLVINCPIEGAEVLVDEESVGFTPLEPVELEPGSHTLRVRRGGYTEFASVIEIRAGETETVSVDMLALAMVLTVRSTPDSANVFVDGTFRGPAPIEIELPEGEHSVRVVAPRFQEVIRQVTARPGQTELLSVELEPIPEELLEGRPAEWYEEPVTWIAIGGGVAALTVAIVLIVYFATLPTELEDFCSPCEPQVIVEGWRIEM